MENALNENYYSVRDKRFEEQKKHADCYNDLLKALPFIDGIGKDNVYDGWAVSYTHLKLIMYF